MDLLDNRVLPGNDFYPVLWLSSLKLTPIVVPAIHQAREFIDITRYHLRNVCLDKMGFFERHYFVLADFRCVEYSSAYSLPANNGENYMSTDRRTTPGVQMGRPPKPAGTGRTRRVVTFVTEDEYAELKDLATDGGISLSALCNDMVTAALRSERMKNNSR